MNNTHSIPTQDTLDLLDLLEDRQYNTEQWLEKVEWTHDHCERCFGAWRPKLIWQEIWCREHYEEAMNEQAEG